MHKPVLIKEIISLLKPFSPKKIIDACYGSGSYSSAFLSTFPSATVTAYDKDPATVGLANTRLKLIHKSFINMSGTSLVDAVIFDLGISSIQLDDPNRGFGFKNSGRLDMRIDTRSLLDAHTVVNTFSKEELVEILNEGEEYRAWIVDEIIKSRPIDTTGELASVIERVS